MSATTIYFGDLLTVLERMGLAAHLVEADPDSAETAQIREVAAAFGIEWQPPPSTGKPLGDLNQAPLPKVVSPTESESGSDSPAPAPPPARGLEFWTVLRKTTRSEEEYTETPPELVNVPPAPPGKWTMLDGEPPKGASLMPWSRLWPFLRQVLGHRRYSRSPDLPRLIQALALGRPLHRLPRRQRIAWCPDVTLLVDRRPGMSPFLDDFEEIEDRIRTLRGRGGLRVVHAQADLCGLLNEANFAPVPLPRDPRQAAVLTLGDLGQYEGPLLARPWTGWGKKARAAGMTPWALCPCPPDRWLPATTRVWNTICWDRHCRPPLDGRGQRALPWPADEQDTAVKHRSHQLDTLFRLVSPAVRVERGFLRDARFLLDHATADAGTEYDAFQSQDAFGNGQGLSLLPKRQRQLRAEFGSQVPTHLLLPLLILLRRHHQHSASMFGSEELDGLKDALAPDLWPLLEQAGLLTPEAEEQAALHWRQIAAGLLSGGFGRHAEAMKAYAMRGISRVEGTIAEDVSKQVIWALNHPDHEGEFPGYINPAKVAFLQERQRMPAIHTISLVDGFRLGATPPHDNLPLVRLYSRWPAATVEFGDDSVHSLRKLRWYWRDSPLLSEADLSQVSTIRIDSGIEIVEMGKLTRPPWAARMWYENTALKAMHTCQGKDYTFERTWTMELAKLVDSHGVWLVDSNGVELYSNTGWQVSVWSCSSPPSWATRLWADEFGLAAEFHIRDVPFVLRWIPPGSFLMGSPEDEAGRREDEGPQHRVTISKGYWMAETPVTQEQWRAVVEAARENAPLWKQLVGENDALNPTPSHFQGPPELPVESITWHDSTTFCRLLDALLPDGPGFHLPTEAQWEYACRAGTQTALHTGEIVILGENHAPALDSIAWYGGNSGNDLEVTNPHDSSVWPKKQYPHDKAGTHRVKTKLPNSHGLHDMLGNVWEWCADEWDEKAYTKRADGVKDPRMDSADDSAFRVVRGGSWNSLARGCRAASRSGGRPGFRWLDRGLRLAAGQEPGAAEPQKPERSDLPENRSAAEIASQRLPEGRAERGSRSRARRAAGSNPA